MDFDILMPFFIFGGIAIVMVAIPCMIVARKGHHSALTFVLALFCWPAAIIYALLCEDLSVKGIERKARKQASLMRHPCPQCKEMIVKSASVCHFCGLQLSQWVEEIGPAAAAAALRKELAGPKMKLQRPIPKRIEKSEKPKMHFHPGMIASATALTLLFAIIGTIYVKSRRDAAAQHDRELIQATDDMARDLNRRTDFDRALQDAQRADTYERRTTQQRQQQELDRARTNIEIQRNQSEREERGF